jgi:hypothetical protein
MWSIPLAWLSATLSLSAPSDESESSSAPSPAFRRLLSLTLAALGLSLGALGMLRLYTEARRACACAADAVETIIGGRLCATVVGVIIVVGGRAGVGGRETGPWRGDDDAEDAGVRLREFGGGLVSGGARASGRCRTCLRSSFEADTVELAPLTDAGRGACAWL